VGGAGLERGLRGGGHGGHTEVVCALGFGVGGLRNGELGIWMRRGGGRGV
jgi:hypothetical protein